LSFSKATETNADNENETEETALLSPLQLWPETPEPTKRAPTHIFLRSQENHLDTPRKRGLLDVANDYDKRINVLQSSSQPLNEADSIELRRLQRDLQSLNHKLVRWVLENVGEELSDLFVKQGPTLTPIQHQFLLQKLDNATLTSRTRRSDKKIEELSNDIIELKKFQLKIETELNEKAAAAKEAEKLAQENILLKRRIAELELKIEEQKQEILKLKRRQSQLEDETSKITGKLLKTRREQKNQVKQLKYWRKKCLEKRPTFEIIIKELRENALIGESYLKMLDSLPKTTSGLLERVANKVNGKKFKGEYDEDIRCFAQTLYHYSPAAYDYVRKSFKNALPHRGTICSWLGQIDAEPGFGGEAFNAIRAEVARLKDTEGKVIKASLIQDEISLKKYLELCGNKVYGYVDMGDNKHVTKDTPQAQYAQCYMIVGLNLRLRLPCGYFFVKSLTGKERAVLTIDCITALEKAGVEVENITFDGTKANVTMAKHLGAQVDNYKNLKPYFTHPVDKTRIINVILDAAHMLKNIRNCLGDKKIFFDGDGGKVEWEYIKNLQENQAEEGLHFANKLNKQHVEYWKKKMKVKLAAQTFSESVAKALELKQMLMMEEFEGAESTIKFIRMVNILIAK
jgi:Transposase protein